MLEAVAALDIDNVRELLGALNRLIAFQAVSEQPLTAEQARMLVGGDDGGGGAADKTEKLEQPRGPRAGARGRRRRRQPASAAASAPSEFDDFLSEIAATVAQQVDAWRARVGAAILRWQGEGFRTAQLEALLEQEMVNDPERALREFEEDVERLQALQAEAAELAPELAGSAAFRDPANLAARRGGAAAGARKRAPPPPAPSPLWRLDGLVETAANRVVVEAARAVVARARATATTRWSSSARPAVGKTHLLHAIGNALAEQGGGPVACLSAPEFTGELIEAIDRDAVAAWRARYRRGGRVPARRRPPHRRQGADPGRAVRPLQRAHGRRPPARVHARAAPAGRVDGRRAAPPLAPRGRAGGRAARARPAVRERVLARDLEAKLGAADPELAAYLADRRPADSIRAAQALLQRVLEAAEARGAPATAALAREVLEEPAAAAPAPRKPSGRSSGIVAPGAGATRSREKMVWEWPEVADRVDRGVALMAIKGSLKEASLPDVIQLLFLGRRTGCLALADRHNFGTSTSRKATSSTPRS